MTPGGSVLPFGIPLPAFGLDDAGLPSRPASWSGELAPYSYVQRAGPCSDTPSDRWGFPGSPRCTIRTQAKVAGQYDEVWGTGYLSFGSVDFRNCSTDAPCRMVWGGTGGTTTATAWVDSDGDGLLDHKLSVGCNRVFLGVIGCGSFTPASGTVLNFQGAYFRIEGVYMNGRANNVRIRYRVLDGQESNTHHVAWRYGEWDQQDTTGSSIGTDGTNQMVLSRMYIHDSGNWPSGSAEVHGVLVSAGSKDVWILESKITRSAGDSVQINSSGAQRVYLGRLDLSDDGENGIDIKLGGDIIISECNIYNYHDETSTGFGTRKRAVVINDEGFTGTDPRIALLFSRIHHFQETGLSVSNFVRAYGVIVENDGGGNGLTNNLNQLTYFENGVMHRVGTAFSHSETGTNSGVIVRNTILSQIGGSPGMWITNNIADSRFDANLAPVNSPFRFGGTAYSGWLAMQAAQSSQATGNQEGVPTFADASTGDFRTSGSLTIDRGVTPEVPAWFLQQYGLNIAFDAAGLARPQGGVWDLGAFEWPENGGPPGAPQNLRIVAIADVSATILPPAL